MLTSFRIFLLCSLWFAIAVRKSFAYQISCEVIFKTIDEKLVCNMQERATIDFSNFTFSPQSDNSLTWLNFAGNKNIFYLPVRISKSFPNMTIIDANECSLITLSKRTFRNLERLGWLNVEQNNIENIPDDVFEDLVLLETLMLSKMQIGIL